MVRRARPRRVALRRVEKELAKHFVTAEVPRGLPLVQMDYVLMEQVLANLLLNAALHTSAGTRVEGQGLLPSVADSGPGIPAEAMPHIFDRFYRAPNTLAGGSGLGLSIAKGLVEAHGGRVEAMNRPASGAEFVVCLPLGEASAPPTESKL
jgi:two-component system sensor histidine kinase KdpD